MNEQSGKQSLSAKSSPPTLKELQQWMRWIITDPRGVAPALNEAPATDLEHRHRYLSPEKDCSVFIDERAPIDRTERLSIYAEAYFARLLESLSADYQTIRTVLGDDAFTKLIADYLKAHPSKETNIGEVGRNLSEFLETHEFTSDVPYLPELARLEWLTIESFYADDLPVLELSRLSEIAPESWPGIRFTLDPSVRLMVSSYPIGKLWNSEESEEIELLHGGLVIYRLGGIVQVEAIDSLQFQTLLWMKQHASLAEICENIIEHTEEMPPLMAWFQTWISSGIIRELN